MLIFNALIIVTFAYFCAASASQWDWEYWQYLNYTSWKSGQYKLYTVEEARLNRDLSKVYYFKITENFAYQLLPTLDLEAHFSLVYNKPIGAARFTHSQRLELEFNPSLSIANGIVFTWRNRMDLLKKQDVSGILSVFRHRLKIKFPIENCGALRAISCSDEIFIDLNNKLFTQNRFIPVELMIALSSTRTMNLFFLVRNIQSISTLKWHRSFVLGSEFDF